MLSNIFLKFREFSLIGEDNQPFSNRFGATASSVLTDFLSTEEIITMPMEDLISYICEKGHNRFPNPENTATLLKQAARNSYHLDKCLYEPLTVSIALSFTLVSAYQAEIKSVNKAIEKTLRGVTPNAYQSRFSIPGIGPVIAAGILSEIGDIHAFKSHESLAKYTGLV